jgi:hypothetical protein
MRLRRRNRTLAPKVVALGGSVMSEQNNGKTDPRARELQELPLAGLQQIGKELRIILTEIIGNRCLPSYTRYWRNWNGSLIGSRHAALCRWRSPINGGDGRSLHRSTPS